jgi:oxidase EvaA
MKKSLDDKHARFLLSALKTEGELYSCADAIEWVERRCREVHVSIEQMRLSEMTDWYLDQDSGRIRHRTGKFFSIDGIHVQTSVGDVKEWRQPIINQPEIGYLGCIVKEFHGVMYFLVQAKIEPGNINTVQLSPTLQATRSNYTQQHKGKAPKYLNYFNDPSKGRVLLDQLQSEQGARFLNKRNRNIIVEIDDDIVLDEDYRWLTLGQIKLLSEYDNIVNMDLRTVISGIPFDGCHPGSLDLWEDFFSIGDSFRFGMLVSALDAERSLYSLDEIISWLTELKAKNDLFVERVSLKELGDWSLTDFGIRHNEDLYFDVRWVSVEIANREVSSWHQPIVAPHQEGLIAFIVKKVEGVYHFLVQAKIESGNFDIFEFAPTVQCITGSYKNSLEKIPFLKYVLNASPDQVRYSALQSEEGGRFYHEQNRNIIIEVGDDFPIEAPPNYKWMTLNQLLSFIKFNNYLNIQTRSLLAGIRFA